MRQPGSQGAHVKFYCRKLRGVQEEHLEAELKQFWQGDLHDIHISR